MKDKRYPRTHRLNESVREVIADEVERLKDPRVGFVTITGVDVAPDLRTATVWCSVLGSDEEREESLRGLRSAAPFLRRALGQLRMKRVPELQFKSDPAIETGLRVEQILRDIQPGQEGDER